MTPRAEKIKPILQERYDRQAEQELFDKGVFEVVTPAKAYFRSRKLSAALELGGFPSNGHLLEIGCSVGQFSLPLARLGYRLTGIDLSGSSVAVAAHRASREGLSNASFLALDAERLEHLPNDSFDGVVSFSTLRYLPQLSTALLEIHRILKPGGRVVADFPNLWCPWFYVKQWLGSESHPCDHWFTEAGLKKIFKETGFRWGGVRKILFTPTVTPDRFLKIFQEIDRFGERIPLLKDLAGILMVWVDKL